MAIQFDPIAKDESLNTTEQNTRNIADVLAQELAGIALAISSGASIASYVLRCPTSGYTSTSVSVWGVTKTLYAITLTADSGSNPLSNFHSGMKEDYPINVDGTQSDFGKLYAHQIGEGQVTLYFTSAPTTAFNVLIREAV
jgi:hypothetical protein